MSIIPKVHLKNEVFKIKNCFNKNHYYIKCIDNDNTNKYLYIDYEEDILKLSEKRTLFQINEKSKNIIEIKLGIYFITFYSTIGKFRNETIYIKYFKDEKEKELIKEYTNESNSFYLKFAKYNNYLNIKKNNDYADISIKPEFKWIFEKIEYEDKEFIYLKRELKNNKFYYTNIEYGDIYTNYYLGWSIDELLW
jgi:hypothetical protein